MNPDSDPAERTPWVRGVVEDLELNDKLSVDTSDGKSRTLTVAEPPEYMEREPYRCNGLVVVLSGYGTTYTLEVPAREYAESKPSKLTFSSAPASGLPIEDVDRVDGASVCLVADKTAADLGIPKR